MTCEECMHCEFSKFIFEWHSQITKMCVAFEGEVNCLEEHTISKEPCPFFSNDGFG